MTDLDALPFATPGVEERPALAPPRRCLHPRDKRQHREDGVIACTRCGRDLDPERARRGKSSRRLGGDQERRIERVYGPRKVGEFGDPVDHAGAEWKWQSKATRALRPHWLALIDRPTWQADLPASILRPLERMAPYYPHLAPVVIRSYVRAGVRPDDYLFVRSADWPWAPRSGYWVVPGTEWLDYLGRDEVTP